MSEDDPRHGTYAGAVAHWRDGTQPCPPCTAAASRRRKLNRLRAHEGNPGLIPAIGTVRRLQALQAIGYGYPTIARETGVSAKTLRNPTHRGHWVYRTTAAKVAATYERLCMTRPIGPYATRSRRMAARKGWPPPLAYNDIDDPHETPADWAYIDPDRATALADLDALGLGITEVCARLGVRRDNLERWCQRHGMSETYVRLTGRECWVEAAS